MAQVTVQSGGYVTIPGSGALNVTLQNQIASAILAAATTPGAHLFTATVPASPGPSVPAVPGSTTVAEALITDAGGNNYSFNSSYGYILDNATGIDTITVAPGTGIISGTVGGVFNLVGGDTVALGGGNNLVQSASVASFPQPDYVAAGGGNDTITEAIGGTIAGGGGTNVLSGSSTAGSLLIISSGSGDTVNALSASGVTVQSSGSNTTINSDSVDAGSSLYVQDTGSNTTLYGGNLGPETISAQGTNLVAAAGQGNLLFLGGAGAVSLFGASGTAESIVGGSGNILYSDLGANASVTGGSGQFVGFGGAGGTITYSSTSSIGGATLVALGGSETLSAAASSVGVELVGADTMFGVPQPTNDVLVGGSGSDTFIGGNGNATMTGGGGKGDLFVFFKTATVNSVAYSVGGGSTLITDFNSADTIFAAGYGASAAAAAINAATVAGGNTTITLADNTKITFAGVSSASTLNGHFLST